MSQNILDQVYISKSLTEEKEKKGGKDTNKIDAK